MSINEQSIQDALKVVVDPNTAKDLVTSRSVKNIKVTGSDVSLDVELGYPAKSQIEGIRSAVIAALKAVPGIGNISANVFSKVVTHAVQKGVKLIPGVKNIIAVAS
ncbi:iron-sulfur cluster assembly protein, partial [Caldilinea sp.]|uniref:iron-sulfur cluster assembly protein n=1 Tax=Caldilinea sp. TaxID=2293560 RepID=UPI002CB75645|nr:iron-sulfur cluster assembly protein [Caldilinea sp.]